jgi:hypothetical protein
VGRDELASKINKDFLIVRSQQPEGVCPDAYRTWTEQPVGFEKKNDPHLTLQKRILRGKYFIPCPATMQPSGLYHSKYADLPIKIYRNPQGIEWMMEVSQDLPKGLHLYYEESKDQYPPPDEMDVSLPINTDLLDARWLNLIDSLNQDTHLTDKKKFDILQNAWRKNFSYSFTERNHTLEDMINDPHGKCHDISVGAAILTRMLGIPSRVVAGYIGIQGHFTDQQHATHAAIMAYIDGKWVIRDPQVSYIDGVNKESKIPRRYQAYIDEHIPQGIYDQISTESNKAIYSQIFPDKKSLSNKQIASIVGLAGGSPALVWLATKGIELASGSKIDFTSLIEGSGDNISVNWVNFLIYLTLTGASTAGGVAAGIKIGKKNRA